MLAGSDDSFEMWYRRRILWRPWSAKKTNRGVLDHIKPEQLLKVKIPKLRLLYFDHEENSLEKTTMPGKSSRQQGKRKTIPVMDWA